MLEEWWLTKDQALELIRVQLKCDSVEAERIYEEFKRDHPEWLKEV